MNKPFALSLSPRRWATLAAAALIALPAFAAQPTSTGLGVYTHGSPAGAVATGTVLTLEARVASASGLLTQGQVIFCSLLAKSCSPSQNLGLAQITPSGVAQIKLRPGAGRNIFVAKYLPTNTYGSSLSNAVTTTAMAPTTSTITPMNSSAFGRSSIATVATRGTALQPNGNLIFTNAFGESGQATLGKATTSQSFAAHTVEPGESESISSAVADFNQDGIPDVVTVGEENAWVFLGEGDGTFAPATNYASWTAVNPRAFGQVAVGDFNGDGFADLAVAHTDEGGIQVLLGKGDGTFGTAVFYTTGDPSGNPGNIPSVLTVADLNGDGIADIAFGDTQGFKVGVLVGNGDGSFTWNPKEYSTGYVSSIAAADVNRDGIPDLIVTEGDNDTVSVLMGLGGGTFAPEISYPTGGGFPTAIQLGDFNGDGWSDVAVVNLDTSTVGILLGTSGGKFQPAVTYPAGNYPSAMAAADYNGDGITDLAVTGANSPSTLLVGRANGTFVSQPMAGGNATGILAADFDGDGAVDLATSGDSFGTVLQNVLTTQVTIDLMGFADVQAQGEYLGDEWHASSWLLP